MFSKAFASTERMGMGRYLDFSAGKSTFGIGTTLEIFQTRENFEER
jgi:hypothetical protein